MRKKVVSTQKVAATYIGTIVGAGFATGQEIMQFFTRFGIMGFTGLIITTLMFIVFGYLIMNLGAKLRAHSHVEIIKYSGGNILGTIIDKIITFFLFISFTAMIAGTGALFAQQFKLPNLIGNFLMAFLTAITVLTGINGVINSISFVVPFLLAAVIGTSIPSIGGGSLDFSSIVSTKLSEEGLMSNWFIAAILYVSYNTIISIAILGPLGAEAENNKAIRNGAILGGLGLGLGSLMIYLALSTNILELGHLEVPMLYIAGKISHTMQLTYSIILIAEIYTTAVGSLFGFVSRFIDIEKEPLKSKLFVLTTTVVAILSSQFGFSNLVKYMYPLIGYIGIIILISLIYSNINYN